ncbi:chemotaxis protein CheB [Fluoribacter dumoffii]|uniref:chemotaxis protein CheB n=1 Tax=Fluoribacter dumoffii TaxID=463 RepID=UPI002242D03B|nr:chemotaxis protein CheB [Fluoribacter dumoffii]MCW8384730.1 chemotaxis protein CheB [Fluoribacter dumoffii]MCW8496870.1 chemotaxis protein CheB [Fluoribacter dumoffii]
MFKNYLIVIGGSAGAITALQNLLPRLPADFPAAILIVIHLPPHLPSRLSNVLKPYSKMPVSKPLDGMILKSNHIYVAPPNFHMRVAHDKIYLTQDAEIHHCRPAIDPLFISAAANYGKQVVGILLSGVLDDGSAGLKEVKEHNGLAIIQSLNEAEFPDLPKHAAEKTEVDFCLPMEDIASLLINHVTGSGSFGVNE